MSSLGALSLTKDLRLLHADSVGTDYSGQMPRLICVFTGCFIANQGPEAFL